MVSVIQCGYRQKRIKIESDRFGYLNYRTRGSELSQIETLIKFAHKDGMTPAYCFYTNNSSSYTKGNCTQTKEIRDSGRVYGCLVGHAEIIRLLRSNKLSNLKPYLVPWHELACVCCAPQFNSDISKLAEAAMRRSLPETAALAGEEFKSGDFFFAGRRRIPEFVRNLLSGAIGGPRWPHDTYNPEWAAARNLKGILAIREPDQPWGE